MKTTFKYIIAAFAVFATLVSCQKENITDHTDDNSAVGNVRVIKVHFGAETKSTLDGLAPKFKDGDTILVSNGTYKEVDTVRVDEKGAFFATSLTGDLTAVYPSDAAKLNGNAIGGVKVPATQDGTFAKANIAKATIASKETSATFENQTSLLRFYVDSTIGVKSITITATGEADIADNSKTITIDPEGDDTLDKVTDDPGKRICYVAVLPGTFTSLTFTSVTTSQTIYEDSKVEKTTGNVSLDTNNIYNAFIPYYIDLGDAGKWGYCNVGAFLPEDAGEYFAWGETMGHKPETDGEGAFVFGIGNAGFAENFSNCPYYIGDNKCTKYMLTGYEEYWGGTGSPDNLKVLEAVDDAATVNWGEVWRMPKTTEFETLVNTYPKELKDFDSGYWFDALFLPAAGNGFDTNLEDVGSWGIYWSSSLNTDDDQDSVSGPGNGNSLEFWYDPDPDCSELIFTPSTGFDPRCLGCSIRPFVAEPANKPLPKPTETGEEEDIL